MGCIVHGGSPAYGCADCDHATTGVAGRTVRDLRAVRAENADLRAKAADAKAIAVNMMAERDEWRSLARELRNQEKRICGILMDLEDDSYVAVAEAIEAISEIVNGPPDPTSAPTSGGT